MRKFLCIGMSLLSGCSSSSTLPASYYKQMVEEYDRTPSAKALVLGEYEKNEESYYRYFIVRDRTRQVEYAVRGAMRACMEYMKKHADDGEGECKLAFRENEIINDPYELTEAYAEEGARESREVAEAILAPLVVAGVILGSVRA